MEAFIAFGPEVAIDAFGGGHGMYKTVLYPSDAPVPDGEAGMEPGPWTTS